ncbi:hypothetical protein H8E77_24460 [bacterium]|nr:hypothetical protein [bacterium]
MFHKKTLAIITTIIIPLLAIIMVTAGIGCGTDGNNIVAPEDTITPGAYTSIEEVMGIIKAHGDTILSETQASGSLMAPSSGNWEKTKEIDDDGGRIKIPVPGVQDPVKFIVPEDSLDDDEITITMRLSLEVANNELVTLHFEFGPSDTQFNPCAKLKIPFELLLTDQVDTFMMTDENGEEIEGVSYDIDDNNEQVITYIPHFSSYYYSRR